ncbi:Acyl dehydratase [Sphingomonas gellani]|uniref:Acyl dehydratase n=1 Tax=Sphingomonas gellani TaxID=1166340 RepID=A0A1H8GR74_9SPHN|nr:MaoC/PaaZ C-terminal domain-containing protein [Sphingomonas gellani]SEN46542.1 Acyl dehydratase [Sphingomonas gellani]
MPQDRYLEDIVPGETSTGAPIAITREAVVAFATEFDPQPMHIDNAAASEGRFGGLIASGWHVASLVMRDFVLSAPFGGTPLLGIRMDNLCWLLPVRPGDILIATREVLEVVRSSKNPAYGRIRMSTTVVNQTGAVAMTMETLIQIPVRGD